VLVLGGQRTQRGSGLVRGGNMVESTGTGGDNSARRPAPRQEERTPMCVSEFLQGVHVVCLSARVRRDESSVSCFCDTDHR